MTKTPERGQILREQGLRLTEQRRTVLEVMARHDEHMTAEDIYFEARQLNPRISLTTVYRTLSILKENAVIEEHHLTTSGADRAHFEMASKPKHVHFQCTRCGKVIELCNPALMEALQQDPNIAEVSHVSAYVEGVCRECAALKNAALPKCGGAL